jgi:hypothetical protein
MSKETLTPFDPSNGRIPRTVPLKQVARMIQQRAGKQQPRQENPQDILKGACWVNVEDVYINYNRQRYPEPGHIKKLMGKWKTHVMTPGQARKDKDGRYFLADGQQHMLAFVNLFPGHPIPLCYVESDDENIESEMLLALNTEQQPMAKYFIHEQHCKMGYKDAIAIEEMTQKANCVTGYKISRPGSITHITDLYNAVEDYGLDSVFTVLCSYRKWWAGESVKTATVLGFLKVKQIMEDSGVYTDELFENVFAESAGYFESADRLHLDIKDEFQNTYPTNYRGMGIREKIASGIINVYEKQTGNTLVAMPFKIDMPMVEDNYAL